MDTITLRELGLTEGEVKVYVALLNSGATTTGEISRRSGVHTSKVYPILDRLMSKGLASFIYRQKIRFYQANSPQHLLDIIRQRHRELNAQEKNVKEIIRRLESQRTTPARQWAAVFEGLEGIRSLFEIMLDEWVPGEEYLVLTPGDEFMDERLNTFFKNHHKKRIEKGITVKVLALESQRSYYKKEYRGVPGFRFRFTKISIPAAINIIHNKVSTLVWTTPPNAFVIDSPLVAEKYREFFFGLWNKAKA